MFSSMWPQLSLDYLIREFYSILIVLIVTECFIETVGKIKCLTKKALKLLNHLKSSNITQIVCVVIIYDSMI